MWDLDRVSDLFKKYWKIIVIALCVALVAAAASQIHTFGVGDLDDDKNPGTRVWWGFNIFFIILAIGTVGLVSVLYLWDNPQKVQKIKDGIGRAKLNFDALTGSAQLEEVSSDTAASVEPAASPETTALPVENVAATES